MPPVSKFIPTSATATKAVFQPVPQSKREALAKERCESFSKLNLFEKGFVVGTALLTKKGGGLLIDIMHCKDK
jgi:hypothetical protein